MMNLSLFSNPTPFIPLEHHTKFPRYVPRESPYVVAARNAKSQDLIKLSNFECIAVGCTESFTNRNDLNEHKKIHAGPANNASKKTSLFNCQFAGCTESFTNKKDLNYHSISHEPRVFKCTGCAETFTDKNVLITHMRFLWSNIFQLPRLLKSLCK